MQPTRRGGKVASIVTAQGLDSAGDILYICSVSFPACIDCGTPFAQLHGWKNRRCTACTPPKQDGFPLALEVTLLRVKWRTLKATLAAVEGAGKWLQAFERRWPEGADQGLQEWSAMKADMQRLIRKLNE